MSTATLTRHVVAKVGEIPENGSKLVQVKGRPIALFHVDGEYFAIGIPARTRAATSAVASSSA